jgi:hypothetical protein
MSASLKLALLCLVIFVLFALAEMLGFPVVVTPGYLLVRTVSPLPDPYPFSSDAVHRMAVSVVNWIFWATVVAAWFMILRARSRRAN